MAGRGGAAPKSVDHGQADHRCVEEQHSTAVGDTSVEGFEALGTGSNGQHCLKDQPVRENNEHRVHSQCGEHHEETVGTVDMGVCTGQLHDIWVQAVRVGEQVIVAVRQPLQHDGGWDVEPDAAHHTGQAQAGDTGAGEDGPVAQGLANGHKTVNSHGQQHRGLHDGESVDEEELGQACICCHLSKTQHVEGEHGGQRGGRQAQISHCQHRQEVVHGLVQGGL